MSLDTWLIYIATVLVFMCTPGPSHLLMISVAMTNGFHRSLATAAGDLSANAIQMTLAGFGLATLLHASETGFSVVKWCGVAYLAWMGIKQIVASFNKHSAIEGKPFLSLQRLWLRGFITSAANPKAVIFFAALFPQFIDHSKPVLTQILILGCSYLIIDGLFLTAYGKSAHWLASRLTNIGRIWLDRASGCTLIATAILLGLKSNKNMVS